jgi:hypothetical protein
MIYEGFGKRKRKANTIGVAVKISKAEQPKTITTSAKILKERSGKA